MNILSNRFRLILLLAVVTLFVVATAALVKASPRFTTSPIADILIGKNWRTDFANSVRISGSEFTCDPDDGKQWTCHYLLEGKPLDMTATYQLNPFQSVTGCTVIYDGSERPCEVTLAFGWNARLLVDDNLGISSSRMAELRAHRPLLYMTESTWLALGVAATALLAFVIMLILLTTLYKKPMAALRLGGLNIPMWMLCSAVIVLALVIHQLSGLMFVLPLGLGGSLLLGLLVVWLNKMDKPRQSAVVPLFKWGAVSLALFWVINIGTVFGLLTLGFVD